MLLTSLLVICLFLFILALPFLFAYIGRRIFHGAVPAGAADRIAELTATIRHIQFVIPALVAVLGFLGFASYRDIIDQVTQKALAEVRNVYSLEELKKIKAQADSMHTSIKANSLEAIRETGAIKGMRQKIDSTLQVIVDARLLNLLPVGTIVAFSGRTIPLNWAVCDGNNGTPNLTGKFILGTTVVGEVGRPGGSSDHSHNVENSRINGSISRQQTSSEGHREGTGAPFTIISYDYTWQPGTQSIQTNAVSMLPPHVKLFYIMKIR